MVTNVPTGPLGGFTPAIVGPKTTVKVRLARVRSSVPARSVAVAPSVWAPSGTEVVTHVAVAVALGAGSGGATPAPRGRPSTVSARVLTPLPVSVAWAWTLTPLRTYVPAGGAWKFSEGGTLSWTIVASAGGPVSPSPAWAVANTSRVFDWFRVSASSAVQAPVPPEVTVVGVVASFRQSSTSAFGSVVPVTVSGD